MTWSKIKAQKEVDRSDPKAVFSEMKSKSFWSWHDTGMKGPENVHQRLRMQKRMVKEKAPLDVSECSTIWPVPHSHFLQVVGKHPVSALVEVCQRRGWNPPAYITEPCKGAGFLLKVNCSSILAWLHANPKVFIWFSSGGGTGQVILARRQLRHQERC